VIEDGSEAETQVGHEAANKVGKRTARDDSNEAADDDGIEVQSKQHRWSKRTPLTLSAKGTSILSGHPKGGLSSNGNFPRLKIANHAHVWLNKNKASDNKGFHTSKVTSILRNPKNKKVWFQDPELHTHKVRPRKGRLARKNAGLVLTVTDKHHRSVLGAVAPALTKDDPRTADVRFK
jgi:hypothetical protein